MAEGSRAIEDRSENREQIQRVGAAAGRELEVFARTTTNEDVERVRLRLQR